MSLFTKVLKNISQGHKNKWYFAKILSSFISKQEGEDASNHKRFSITDHNCFISLWRKIKDSGYILFHFFFFFTYAVIEICIPSNKQTTEKTFDWLPRIANNQLRKWAAELFLECEVSSFSRLFGLGRGLQTNLRGETGVTLFCYKPSYFQLQIVLQTPPDNSNLLGKWKKFELSGVRSKWLEIRKWVNEWGGHASIMYTSLKRQQEI